MSDSPSLNLTVVFLLLGLPIPPSSSQPEWYDKVVAFYPDSTSKSPWNFRAQLVLNEFKNGRVVDVYDGFLRNVSVFRWSWASVPIHLPTKSCTMSVNHNFFQATLLYFPTHQDDKRILEHFYSFMFFSSPEVQSYYKRFVRDSLRYKVRHHVFTSFLQIRFSQ